MIRCRSSLTNCRPPTDNRLAGSRLAARSRGCSVRIALDVELGELVRLRLDLKRQAAHRDWGRGGGRNGRYAWRLLRVCSSQPARHGSREQLRVPMRSGMDTAAGKQCCESSGPKLAGPQERDAGRVTHESSDAVGPARLLCDGGPPATLQFTSLPFQL